MGHNPVLRSLGRAGMALWSRVPRSALDSRPFRILGHWIHKSVCLSAARKQGGNTWFLRNTPLLTAVVQKIQTMDVRGEVRLCDLGCSTGAELYSALWMFQSVAPQIRVLPVGVDISSTAVERAKQGTYRLSAPELQGISSKTPADLFYREGEYLVVRPWLRQGVRWLVADARDPGLLALIGQQDVVFANNFLVHMKDEEAIRCMSGLIRLIRAGGLLVCRGVDLDVRVKVAQRLGLQPVTELIEEIHNAEPDLDARRDWPWRYWALEPMDKQKRNWAERYAAIFQVPGQEICASRRAKAAGR